MPHLKQLSELMDKGVGLGCIHYAVEVPKGESGDDWLKWIGGYFEVRWSINPFWEAHFGTIPQKHPVSSGVRPFVTTDEWYYHMRFRENMEGVTPILSAVPPDKTRQRRDDDHGGNPAVRAGIGKHILETTLWVSERPGDGRGFGCTGGHVHWNWAQDDFRKTVLNAIIWIAHVDVPKEGVASKTPTVDELIANQDEPVPADLNKDDIQKRIEKMNTNASAHGEK
jgi:type 1 glutamine amidotransferase